MQVPAIYHNVNSDGELLVDNPRTAFGKINAAENQAFIQAVPVYGLIPANFRAD